MYSVIGKVCFLFGRMKPDDIFRYLKKIFVNLGLITGRKELFHLSFFKRKGSTFYLVHTILQVSPAC